jgi:DNA-binding HxlR family transcriptional regulator
VLHGKWTSTLLSCIAQGIQRPSAMQRTIPSATRRVLNVQLAQLEQHGLISKTIFPELPPKVEYQLTRLGQSLLPVIEVMEQWNNAHRTGVRTGTGSEFSRAARLARKNAPINKKRVGNGKHLMPWH